MGADPQLNLRWNIMRNELGLPHIVTIGAMVIVSKFADAELLALVAVGGNSQNQGLPSTYRQPEA